MSGDPIGTTGPKANAGKSDWDDEDLLTIAEASDRLAQEIKGARERIRKAEEVLTQEDSPAVGAVHASGLAAERERLEALMRAVERIKAAQADAPR